MCCTDSVLTFKHLKFWLFRFVLTTQWNSAVDVGMPLSLPWKPGIVLTILLKKGKESGKKRDFGKWKQLRGQTPEKPQKSCQRCSTKLTSVNYMHLWLKLLEGRNKYCTWFHGKATGVLKWLFLLQAHNISSAHVIS